MRSGRFARLLAAMAALLALSFATLSIGALSAAGAHTDLLQGSPGPSQQVGGTVDFVDLVFVEAVEQASITLRTRNGDMIDGETVVTEGQFIRFEMPELSLPGRYVRALLDAVGRRRSDRFPGTSSPMTRLPPSRSGSATPTSQATPRPSLQ